MHCFFNIWEFIDKMGLLNDIILVEVVNFCN